MRKIVLSVALVAGLSGCTYPQQAEQNYYNQIQAQQHAVMLECIRNLGGSDRLSSVPKGSVLKASQCVNDAQKQYTLAYYQNGGSDISGVLRANAEVEDLAALYDKNGISIEDFRRRAQSLDDISWAQLQAQVSQQNYSRAIDARNARVRASAQAMQSLSDSTSAFRTTPNQGVITGSNHNQTVTCSPGLGGTTTCRSY